MFVWESWITIKIRHQTERNSFETKHEIPRRVASNIMRLSVTYPVCSFQSFVPVKLSFNSVFASISLGNSYEHEALATTVNIRRAWNIRCIIFSHPELHLNSNTWWLYLFGCAGQWIRHRQYTCSFGSGRHDRDLPESFRLAGQKWTEHRGFVSITMWLLLESSVCSLL